MGAHRLRQILGLTLVGFVLAAAISFASAQEGPLFTAALEQDTAGAGGAALALASEEGPLSDGVMAEEAPSPAVVVAQTPPLPSPAVAPDAAAVTTGKTLLNERAWSDAHTTIVECTGDVTRTCQVNVYGPNGEFILGRKFSPNGEAADCSGPCLDSTGAPLDASSVSRAQAAIAAGNRTFGVITSPSVPQVVETPSETQAEPLRREGE